MLAETRGSCRGGSLRLLILFKEYRVRIRVVLWGAPHRRHVLHRSAHDKNAVLTPSKVSLRRKGRWVVPASVVEGDGIVIAY